MRNFINATQPFTAASFTGAVTTTTIITAGRGDHGVAGEAGHGADGEAAHSADGEAANGADRGK